MAKPYFVTLTNNGTDFWLKGSTWTFSADRADFFETEEKARAALLGAKKFMLLRLFKMAKIQTV